MKVFFYGALVVALLSGCGVGSVTTSDKGVADAIGDLNKTLDDKNTSVSVDVNNDVNTTVYPPIVDINNTVVIQYNDVKIPALGSGTFSDPYILRQAVYDNIGYGLHWFIADNLNVNCTISAISSVSVRGYNVYDDQFNIVSHGYAIAFERIKFDINNTSFSMIGISYSEGNATTLFAGDCLSRPVFYQGE